MSCGARHHAQVVSSLPDVLMSPDSSFCLSITLSICHASFPLPLFASPASLFVPLCSCLSCASLVFVALSPSFYLTFHASLCLCHSATHLSLTRTTLPPITTRHYHCAFTGSCNPGGHVEGGKARESRVRLEPHGPA